MEEINRTSEKPKLSDILGKTILLGLTHKDSEGKIIRREQVYGIVEKADKSSGIIIRSLLEKGKEAFLPPDLRGMQYADKGKYTLKETGREVVDPDLFAAWVIEAPHASSTIVRKQT
jgi:hypothetical protein